MGLKVPRISLQGLAKVIFGVRKVTHFIIKVIPSYQIVRSVIIRLFRKGFVHF